MNTKLIAAAETLADKAAKDDNAYNAAQFAQAAFSLVQAATSLLYAEAQPTGVGLPPSDASTVES